MIVGTLIYSLAPDALPNRNKFRWPSNPEKIERPENSAFINENLLVQGKGLEAVQRHCLNCHSARLIVQNRMSKERWEDNIKWMQETQGLWDLGADHPVIIDYLSTQYAPQSVGRRGQLSTNELEWYMLE